MNVGHFEQISDCWSSEGQPAKYYRTAAARARMLQADSPLRLHQGVRLIRRAMAKLSSAERNGFEMIGN